jgi:hypothetical protein
MATEKQIAANRLNALKSTGPRTAAGKRRSSQNALKHGAHANHLIVATEDESSFAAHADRLQRALSAGNFFEEDLLRIVVQTTWITNRIAVANNIRLDRAITELAAQQADAPNPITDPAHLTSIALNQLESDGPSFSRQVDQQIRLARASERFVSRLEERIAKHKKSRNEAENEANSRSFA